jgi:hypothetical protein
MLQLVLPAEVGGVALWLLLVAAVLCHDDRGSVSCGYACLECG